MGVQQSHACPPHPDGDSGPKLLALPWCSLTAPPSSAGPEPRPHFPRSWGTASSGRALGTACSGLCWLSRAIFPSSVCSDGEGCINLGEMCVSHSVVSDSLRPHGLQHARPPCPPLSPRVCSNSCPSSQWCCSTISSSVIPFSCLQSFPASGSSFPVSQFASGGQRIGVSASASVLPMSIQGWSLLGLSGWISLLSKGLCWRPYPQFFQMWLHLETEPWKKGLLT